jgi:hypothetical protein
VAIMERLVIWEDLYRRSQRSCDENFWVNQTSSWNQYIFIKKVGSQRTCVGLRPQNLKKRWSKKHNYQKIPNLTLKNRIRPYNNHSDISKYIKKNDWMEEEDIS